MRVSARQIWARFSKQPRLVVLRIAFSALPSLIPWIFQARWKNAGQPKLPNHLIQQSFNLYLILIVTVTTTVFSSYRGRSRSNLVVKKRVCRIHGATILENPHFEADLYEITETQEPKSLTEKERENGIIKRCRERDRERGKRCGCFA